VNPQRQLQRAAAEIRTRAAEIVGALGVAPGAALASFGLTEPGVVSRLLEQVGADGRVYTVSRREAVHRSVEKLALQTGRRLQPIFALDGDAHLEAGSATLVILIDAEGFFLRPAELYRQAREVLPAGGRLAILRLPNRTGRTGRMRPPEAPRAQEARSPARQGPTGSERIAIEAAGFRWVGLADVLQTRELWIFERADG
jgi:hypothetical protein